MFTAAAQVAAVRRRVTAHSGRVGLARSELTSRGASTVADRTAYRPRGRTQPRLQQPRERRSLTLEVGLQVGACRAAGRRSGPRLVVRRRMKCENCGGDIPSGIGASNLKFGLRVDHPLSAL